VDLRASLGPVDKGKILDFAGNGTQVLRSSSSWLSQYKKIKIAPEPNSVPRREEDVGKLEYSSTHS
jgi:hypothetical protein